MLCLVIHANFDISIDVKYGDYHRVPLKQIVTNLTTNRWQLHNNNCYIIEMKMTTYPFSVTNNFSFGESFIFFFFVLFFSFFNVAKQTHTLNTKNTKTEFVLITQQHFATAPSFPLQLVPFIANHLKK